MSDGPPEPQRGDDGELDEPSEDEVPTIVLYVIAGLILLAFTVYLVVGGHEQLH